MTSTLQFVTDYEKWASQGSLTVKVAAKLMAGNHPNDPFDSDLYKDMEQFLVNSIREKEFFFEGTINATYDKVVERGWGASGLTTKKVWIGNTTTTVKPLDLYHWIVNKELVVNKKLMDALKKVLFGNTSEKSPQKKNGSELDIIKACYRTFFLLVDKLWPELSIQDIVESNFIENFDPNSMISETERKKIFRETCGKRSKGNKSKNINIIPIVKDLFVCTDLSKFENVVTLHKKK